MKNFIIILLALLLWFLLIDSLRISGWRTPLLKLYSNCEYTDYWTLYTIKWLWYSHIEKYYRWELRWAVEWYILWLKTYDFPSWDVNKCVK